MTNPVEIIENNNNNNNNIIALLIAFDVWSFCKVLKSRQDKEYSCLSMDRSIRSVPTYNVIAYNNASDNTQ